MKMIIVVALALVAAAMAAPAEEKPVEILEAQHTQESEGNYDFGFKSSDGIERSEEGKLVEANNEEGKPQRVVTVRGSYSYTDPEGNIQIFSYTADENGFRAEGPSIPKNVEPVV